MYFLYQILHNFIKNVIFIFVYKKAKTNQFFKKKLYLVSMIFSQILDIVSTMRGNITF